MSLVVISADNGAEVVSSGKTLLYRHNSTNGFNISCLKKTLNLSLNFNITGNKKLIDTLSKIPKGFITTLTVRGAINNFITPNDIIFLKDNLTTKVFDEVGNYPKHWCVIFYKSDINKYNLIKEEFGNQLVKMEMKVNDILETTKKPELVMRTPLDKLRAKISILEKSNKELTTKLDEKNIEYNKKFEELQELLIDSSKKIEETYDIFNKFHDSMDKKIESLEKKNKDN